VGFRRPQWHPALAQTYNKYGYVLRLLGDIDASINAHTEAHRMLCATIGTDDPRTAMALSNLGLAYRDAGNQAESATAQQHAQRVLQIVHGPDHPNTLLIAERLAGLGPAPTSNCVTLQAPPGHITTDAKRLEPERQGRR
jgi:hypothetical protein